MDKNKSRTDLLAAGRKKLQQFRQKKDGKGNGAHGKSSRKQGKSEQVEDGTEPGATSGNSGADESEVSLSQHSESNLFPAETPISSVSEFPVVSTSSLLPESKQTDVSPALETQDNLYTHISESVLKDSAGDEATLAGISGEAPVAGALQPIDQVTSGVQAVKLPGSEANGVQMDRDNETEERPAFYPGYSSEVSASTVGLDDQTWVGGKDVLVSDVSAPGMLLIQEEAAQGADFLVRNQDGGGEVKVQRDEIHSLPTHTDTETVATSAEEDAVRPVHELKQVVETDNLSIEVTPDDDVQPSIFLPDKNAPGESADGGEKMLHEDIPVDEISSTQSATGEHVTSTNELCESDIKITEVDDLPKIANDEKTCNVEVEKLEGHFERRSSGDLMSHSADLNSVSFSDLISAVKVLNEDKLCLLLKARDLYNSATLERKSHLGSQAHYRYGEVKWLEEELFSTNLTKDLISLQLEETFVNQKDLVKQYNLLLSEMSFLHTSLAISKKKEDSLTEELTQYRSEYQVITHERDNFHQQLVAAREETEQLCGRVRELQSSLALSEENLSSLREEVAAFKGAIADFDVEREQMNEILASMSTERNKLEEEKNYLSSGYQKLVEEFAESQKLLRDLEDENTSSKEDFASLTESSRKLEDERYSLVHVNEQLSTELANFRILVESLENARSDLNKTLLLVKEEAREASAGRDDLSNECQRLSSEIVVLQEQLSIEQGEVRRLKGDLEGKITHLGELSQENAALASKLEACVSNSQELNKDQDKRKSFADVVRDFTSSQIPSGDSAEQYPSEFLEKGEADVHVLEKLPSEYPVTELSLNPSECAWGLLEAPSRNIDEILQKLENAIQGMHSFSSSSSKSGDNAGKSTKAAVSKLIQAFESKSQSDDNEEEGLSDDQSRQDLHAFSLEQIQNLKEIFKQLVSYARSAAAQLRREVDGRVAFDLTIMDLKTRLDILDEYANNLESSYIEVGVMDEVLNQGIFYVMSRSSELDTLYGSLKEQNSFLQTEIVALNNELRESTSTITHLESELRQKTGEALVLSNQFESLEKMLVEMIVMLQLDWSVCTVNIVETLSELDKHAGVMMSHAFDGLDLAGHVDVSVGTAVGVIETLRERLERVTEDHESVSRSLEDVNVELSDLQGLNDLAAGLLRKIHGNLKDLVVLSLRFSGLDGHSAEENVNIDPLDAGSYQILIENLRTIVDERLQLETKIDDLQSQLKCRMDDIQELNGRCLDMDFVQKFIKEAETVMKLEGANIDFNAGPASCLESLFAFVLNKYMEVNDHIPISREIIASREMESNDLTEKLNQSNYQNNQHEDEILILRESLNHTQEALSTVQAQLRDKGTELEQSEQRVSSLREKLGIAVAKGKGLVVQRDSLKQSLAEVTGELERCSQDLQSKESKIVELEIKLGTYAEAGERVEALESELSYIRNSATALRESFLLKDSLLQRIEEILEDLDLPEHFHAMDILEKVDWLGRSVTGNPLPPAEWDQKSSIGGSHGGSYSDAGLVMDSWREDMQTAVAGDDLRRKYDELQGKFYGLAEQNEMLEQSLLERNYIIQRWEGIMERIDVPSNVRTVEPVDRIEWLCKALSDANDERSQLQQKIDGFDKYCSSLTADIEKLQVRITQLEADLHGNMLEKGQLLERLDRSMKDQEALEAKARHLEIENDGLQSDANAMERRLAELVEYEKGFRRTDEKLRGLLGVVNKAFLDPAMDSMSLDDLSIDTLEEYFEKLVDKCIALSSTVSTTDASTNGKPDEKPSELDSANKLDVLTKQLEDAWSELLLVKEERDKCINESRSLGIEAEVLRKQKEDLQDLMSQEEQKTASLREKLNVAVRKGKSLVQQRDGLKQTIEEMNREVAQLKSEITHRDNVIADHEQKMKELSSHLEKAVRLESEALFLRNSLAEAQTLVEDKGHTLEAILSTLANIDVVTDVSCSDPVEKLRQVEKICRNLHEAASSSEKEAIKSRRAAELLLAELNEVQDRNDNLQEEISHMAGELSRLAMEKDALEASKIEAISELENLSAVSAEERKKLSLELMVLQSTSDLLKKVLSNLGSSLGDVLSDDLGVLHKLEAAISSRAKRTDAPNIYELNDSADHLSSVLNDIVNEDTIRVANIGSNPAMLELLDDATLVETCTFLRNQLQESVKVIVTLEGYLLKHVASFQGQTTRLSQAINSLNTEVVSRESISEIQRDVEHLKFIGKEKDMEIASLHRVITSLSEACSVSLREIEITEASLMDMSRGNFDGSLTTGERFNLPLRDVDKALALPSEEFCKSLAERLLLCVKRYSSARSKLWEQGQNELKATIANLQRKLYEKDVEKERACKDLVNQIKKAEAAANVYSSDLQSSKILVDELREKVKTMEEGQGKMMHQLKEFEDQRLASAELEERVRSLSELVASKDQEIGALMQALDEEESQMEQLTKKNEELEKLLLEKELAMKDLEVSRGKALKKLSVTVGKFDELHNFSVSLLSEIEKLQSHIKEQDAEISFLRQEVTRCTNEVIASSQSSNNAATEEFYDFLSWIDDLLSGAALLKADDMRGAQLNDCRELLQKKVASISTELEDLRTAAHGRDALLQAERSRVEALMQKGESLEKALQEKEYQLSLRQSISNSGQQSGLTSEIVEVEPVRNKRTAATTSTPQVRNLRKGNNDQVAVVIDMDPSNKSPIEDEDDDKVHGFKSLTTSRFVPKFTRRVTDMVDGLWVSCDRTLMRQPTLRLAIIIYWAVLHSLLAAFIV
ncbi:hypothetical protein MLD38_006001 [Melastoma candidum]|uniref:Uncharacterized protein n=1 Tax=Melastoma candidum TaxID=119954 RepID=A0ACB9RUY6_9MYRT|nr:hypothetical protein MLD38_006001 [Melastoma candidum]